MGIPIALANFEKNVTMVRGAYRPFLVAGITVAGSATVRLMLDPLVGSKVPFLPFLCGIVFAALIGGLRAGIASTLLTIPVVDYLFIEPRHTFFIHDAQGDSISLAVFLGLGIALSFLIERFRQTRERLGQALLELQRSESRLSILAATVPEMLFTATTAGDIDYVSQRFREFTGMEEARMRTDWMEALHPEDRGPVLQLWSQALQSGREFEATYRLRRRDGEYRWFKGHAQPVRSTGGELTQWTGVCSDIHEQKLLTQALARRTEQLIESNEEFQKFAYRITHDLKEPLRMIGTFTEMLVKRNQDSLDGESQTFTKYILDGVGRVEHQIRELLEYARAGSVEIRSEPIDFNAVLESAIDNLRSSMIQTGAIISHDQLPILVANPDRIRSLFQNLLGNALKYRGTRAPRIHVSARRESEEWVFSVRDNGIGFRMDQAERIFTAFERLPSEKNVPGSGLGLAIVKRIAEMKGGRVWAESEPGAGSTFFFALPRRLEKIEPAQARSQAAGVSSNARAS
ncbi:MAG TPA: ATP-binding protein [Bryobacteraceae bacterium]|nr:ATP-binding protein [Bryobacteraceae bacterium]